MRGKLLSWLLRYGPPELLGTATAYAGYYLGLQFGGHPVLAAYCGAIGENCGFYGLIALRERRDDRARGVPAAQTWRNLLVEFGPAEALDSLLVRPAMMGLGAHWAGGWGVLLGKLAADVCFYVPAIMAYEWRKLRDAAARRRRADGDLP